MFDVVLIAIIVVGILSGFLAKKVAERKGLDPREYFYFGIFGLLVVILKAPRGLGNPPGGKAS